MTDQAQLFPDSAIPRPSPRDKAIVVLAAKQLADSLCAGILGDDCGSPEEIAADIAKYARYHYDGYQIARDLEQ
jgi:hypothetical protein